MMNLLLLFMSLVFYAFGEPKYLALLLVSVLISYLGGLVIGTAAGAGRKQAALAVTVLLHLALLGYFKYDMFFVETVNGLAGREVLTLRQIALPIGISFYTFQALSYVIDLYRGRCSVQKSFYKLLLYISFFPQLIAGPIVRYRDIADQIDDRSVDFDGFCLGVTRFVIGLGKKVILANTFAVAVDRVFALEDAQRGMWAAWYGMILYALQIYFDFSGYSDMAIGMGKMFGFDFLENFRLPYISGSIREFWRRWHISLSTWFQEYLYIPLGGSRCGIFRTCVNLFVVFLVTGIWHGAGWNFVIWGLIHGVFIIVERLIGSISGRTQGSLGGAANGTSLSGRSGAAMCGPGASDRFCPGSWIKEICGHVYCLAVVLIAWVFFRAETPGQALAYLGTMFSVSGIGTIGFHELFGTKLMILSGVGVLLAGVLPEKLQLEVRDSGLFRGLALPVILFVCILLLAADSYNPFIYFRF